MHKKYSIKEGVLFRPYGEKSLLTDDKLTDSLAEYFLQKDPSLLGTVIIINEDTVDIEVNSTKKKSKNKRTNKSKK